MVLRRANPLLGALKAVGPGNLDFPGPTPSNGPRNGSCPPQNHYVPCHINNRYINSYHANISPGIAERHSLALSVHRLLYAKQIISVQCSPSIGHFYHWNADALALILLQLLQVENFKYLII